MNIEAAIARWEDEGEEAWERNRMITDEMVKLAFNAWWNTSHEDGKEPQMRAALEAVVPMLISEAFQTRPPALIKEALDQALNKARAQGMREMAELMECKEDHDHLIDRAQELDPK